MSLPEGHPPAGVAAGLGAAQDPSTHPLIADAPHDTPGAVLTTRVAVYSGDATAARVAGAVAFAVSAHEGQARHSGEPYHTHVIAVAEILADLKLDASTIIAGVLHDTVEDTPVSDADLRAAFGDDVADLVDGVTKLGKLAASNRAVSDDSPAARKASQAENFQKFILASARDLRVLLIKLADRLHNMRTLGHHPKADKRQRIASETLEIYAPLARRIGLHALATEMEDLAFAEAAPEVRAAIQARLDEFLEETTTDIDHVYVEIAERMRAAGVDARLIGRVKQPYSIWRKLQRKSVNFGDLADIFAFRLIVKDEAACYQALGVAHRIWRALPDRFKDYISTPKPNGYRSLHTTVQGPGNRRVELQIRTAEMDAAAERGVAAHWQYKNDTYGFNAAAARAAGFDPEESLRTFAEMLAHGAEADEFMEHAKREMYADQVFAFTPKGRLIRLPNGATPVDFAYAVHTEIGDTCVGARINGEERPLRTRLNNGDQVEIIRSDRPALLGDWESLAVTGRARSAIRRLVRLHRHEDFVRLGRSLLDRQLQRIGVSPIDVNYSHLAGLMAVKSAEELFARIGEGSVKARKVTDLAYPAAESQDDPDAARIRVDEDNVGVLVAGSDLTPGVSLHVAECCYPLPGDRIVGIHTGERGVIVHAIDCPVLEDYESDPEVWVDLAWTAQAEEDVIARARIDVTAANKRGVLALLCKAVADARGNIVNIKTIRRAEDFFDLQFDVEVEDTKHLTQILATMRTLSAVDKAERAREQGE